MHYGRLSVALLELTQGVAILCPDLVMMTLPRRGFSVAGLHGFSTDWSFRRS